METTAILLAGAAGGYVVAQLLRAPAIPFLLGAGALLANAGALPIDALTEALSLGVVFLLFVGGTELNPERVGGQRGAALRIGFAQFLLLGAAGWLAAAVAGFDLRSQVYLALALTASSTLVVVRLLQRRQQLFEPLGRMVLGVLLLQDLLVIALVPVLSGASLGPIGVLRQLGATALLALLAWMCVRWVGHRLVRLRDDDESLLLVTLALLFAFLGAAWVLRVPLVSAAFLAGVALSTFPVSGLVRRQLLSITDFFAAVFFTALGGLLRPPAPAELALAVAFAVLIIGLTPPIVALVAERSGFSARPAIEGGLLLSQTSELSLVVALQGMVTGQIEGNVFTVVALTTALTMLITPLISTGRATGWFLRLHPLRRETHVDQVLKGHVVLVGCGDAGMPLLETLLASGRDVVVVDDDPAVVSRLREGGLPAIRGHALDPGALRDAAVAEARIISSTVRRPEDNELLLEKAGRVPTLVRVFDDAQGEWVSARGGRPVVAAAAAAGAFFRWWDARTRPGP